MTGGDVIVGTLQRTVRTGGHCPCWVFLTRSPVQCAMFLFVTCVEIHVTTKADISQINLTFPIFTSYDELHEFPFSSR